MKNKIKVLPESVANQIAAGEVVQRPASAVKELLENSIDSGADFITLNIKDAGKALIQIIDNGHGMTEMDARLCVERHATSKISGIDDIFKIRTMGFRGEALASISAVSQSEIKSKTEDAELATKIKMSGSEVVSQEQENGKTGTSISVKNLFFNVPARRNFLKSNNVENRHINEAFQQIALSSPQIGFSYFNNGEEIFKLDKTNLKQRIIQLFGKRFEERLVPVKEETEIVRITGFVGKPEFATVKRSEQFFLVNGRFVKSPYLHHAVMSAFEDLLSKEVYPQYFLNLEIDPSQIDINIHPTKTEIKFLEERSIYAILRTCIRQSLGKFNIAPSLDFERETAFDNLSIDKSKAIKMPEIMVDKSFNPFISKSVLIQPGKEEIRKGSELFDVEVPKENITPEFSAPIESMINQPETEASTEKSKIIQLHNKFILTHLKSGLMVIDQHRAHKRVLFEKFILGRNKSRASQKLLFPILVEMNKTDFDVVREIYPDLEKMGFSIEEFGKDSLSINGVPPGSQEKEIKEIFLRIIEKFKVTGDKSKDSRYDKLSIILASQLAIKSGQVLQEKEMESLIDQLFACEMPYSLPNGKPIIITISLDEISKKFQY